MAETSKKNIESQQLEMFGDIGMAKSPAKKDPVSGNEIPKASTAEEVRDDIPARLSEGEFVLPADVVRYHGLEKLMNLRQEAKQGINTMDKMGQLGNADEATMPDDLPFDINDIEMAEGGFVNVAGQPMPLPTIAGKQMEMQVGGFVSPTGTYQVPTNIATAPSYFQNYAQSVAPFTPFVPSGETQIPPVAPTTIPKTTGPTFQTLIPSEGQRPVTKEYRNEAGQKLFIPFVNNKPIYPIPEGYTEYVEEKTPIVEDKPTVKTPTTTITGDGESTDSTRVSTTTVGETGKSLSELSSQDIQKSFGTMSTSQRGLTVMNALDKAKGQTGLARGLQQFATAVTPGVLAAKMVGQKTFDPRDVLSQVGRPDTKDLNSVLNAFGPSTVGLTPEEIDMQGIDRKEALSQAIYGMSYAEATKTLGVAPTFTKGHKNGQVDPITGATYSFGQATDDNGNVSYGSVVDFGIAMSATVQTGFMGGLKDAQRVAEKGKTEKARQRAKDFINIVKTKSIQKEQSKKDKIAVRDPKGGIGESTGPGSQTIGIETDVHGIADQTALDTSGIDTSGIGQGVGATGGLGGPGGVGGIDYGGIDESNQPSGDDDDPGGVGGGGDAFGGLDFKQGGLAKRKTKVKKMKRGGLASR